MWIASILLSRSSDGLPAVECRHNLMLKAKKKKNKRRKTKQKTVRDENIAVNFKRISWMKNNTYVDYPTIYILCSSRVHHAVHRFPFSIHTFLFSVSYANTNVTWSYFLECDEKLFHGICLQRLNTYMPVSVDLNRIEITHFSKINSFFGHNII